MKKAKTNEQFTKEVYEMVGDEYTFLESYKYGGKKLPVVHNTCGHRYEVIPSSFLSGRRCPECNSRRKLTNEMFLEKVRGEVGDEYTFLESYVNSHTKLNVVHNTCGRIYKVKPTAFLNSGSRCSKCRRKNIVEMFVTKIKEEVGDEYTFLEPYKKSSGKLPVLHNTCGHRYKVSPASFLSMGTRCPKCNSGKWTDEMFLEKVRGEVGDEYTFLETYDGSVEKLTVIHNTCGHIYKVKPSSFLYHGNRCPDCIGTSSKGERKIADYLDKLGILYKKEKTFSDLKAKNKLRYDFAVYHKGELLTLIEYDGLQHFEEVELFGGEEQLLKTQEHDRIKNEYAKQNNIPLLRIPYNKYDSIEEIIDRYLSDHF